MKLTKKIIWNSLLSINLEKFMLLNQKTKDVVDRKLKNLNTIVLSQNFYYTFFINWYYKSSINKYIIDTMKKNTKLIKTFPI
jgi:hypothetical protein